MAAAHVFAPDLEGLFASGAVELADDDRHHLGRVLRLRAGEEVTVSDGAGALVPCVVAGSGADLRLEPVGGLERRPPPDPLVTVAFALTKGDKPEWAVQKLTELGVDRILLYTAERSVVRWDRDKVARNVERLRRVAREAAMQSRRVWLPEVHGVATFAALAAQPGAALAHAGGDPPSLRWPTVLVGPEGGFSPAELAQAQAQVDLGPTVLRAETAAVTVGAMLCALRCGLVTQREGSA